jgi:hypothetical protein
MTTTRDRERLSRAVLRDAADLRHPADDRGRLAAAAQEPPPAPLRAAGPD